jgi:hypothetical protein
VANFNGQLPDRVLASLPVWLLGVNPEEPDEVAASRAGGRQRRMM